MERRTFERFKITFPVIILLEENNYKKKIKCHIINMSVGGALFKIDDISNDDVNDSIIRKTAKFEIKIGIDHSISYRGKIARFFFGSDNCKYIAAYFFIC